MNNDDTSIMYHVSCIMHHASCLWQCDTLWLSGKHATYPEHFLYLYIASLSFGVLGIICVSQYRCSHYKDTNDVRRIPSTCTYTVMITITITITTIVCVLLEWVHHCCCV